MTDLSEDIKKIEKFLSITKTIDKFELCQTIYDLFEIKNKNSSYSDIEKKIEEFVKNYSGNNAPKFKVLGKIVSSDAEIIKRVLREHKQEYDSYLQENDPNVKKIRGHFNFLTKRDRELDSQEKIGLIEEAKEIGLSETEVVSLINQWLIEIGVEEVDKKTDATSSSKSIEDFVDKTHYEILGVSEDADYNQLKEAYDKEHQKYINAGGRNKAKVSARLYIMTEAWECLKDPVKRKEYDKQLKTRRESDTSFKNDLVFRSGGKACSLIAASDLIDKYWDEAKEMLNHKDLENWIGANGETVIANEVRVINKTEENKDIALEKAVQAFKLGKKSPEISIHPSLIDMGNIEQGKIIRQSLKVSHAGNRGFLYGEIVKSGGGIRVSHTNILLKPKESVTVDLEIDTSSMPVHKNYKFIIKTNTNAIKNAEASVSFYISYPVSQTRLKVFFYGIGGAGIGLALRGLLTSAGLKDWLFNYYTYSAWKGIWNHQSNLPYAGMTIVFSCFIASFYLIYKVGRK